MDMLIYMLIRHSRRTQSLEAASSSSADHTEAVPSRLHSRRTARQCQDNIMLHRAPQFLLLSPHPFTLTHPGELGHQVAHTVMIHYPLFDRGYALGQKPQRSLTVGVPKTRPIPCKNGTERGPLPLHRVWLTPRNTPLPRITVPNLAVGQTMSFSTRLLAENCNFL